MLSELLNHFVCYCLSLQIPMENVATEDTTISNSLWCTSVRSSSLMSCLPRSGICSYGELVSGRMTKDVFLVIQSISGLQLGLAEHMEWSHYQQEDAISFGTFSCQSFVLRAACVSVIIMMYSEDYLCWTITPKLVLHLCKFTFSHLADALIQSNLQ